MAASTLSTHPPGPARGRTNGDDHVGRGAGRQLALSLSRQLPRAPQRAARWYAAARGATGAPEESHDRDDGWSRHGDRRARPRRTSGRSGAGGGAAAVAARRARGWRWHRIGARIRIRAGGRSAIVRRFGVAARSDDPPRAWEAG